MSTKNCTFRTRNWVSILYPESAKENWESILSEQHVQAFVSPLHDSDVSHDGTNKKPHYHVVLMFQGPKTEAQAQEVFDLIGAVKCQAVKDLRGTCRYLCHLDDANKAQYSVDDVKCFSGSDFYTVISLTSDRYESIREMMEFIDENGIILFKDIVQYSRQHKPMWFRSLCDNSTVIIKEYLRSCEYELKVGTSSSN